MRKRFKIGLQFFADGGGGDGGAASAGSGTSTATGVGQEAAGTAEFPASMPERAKQLYRKAQEDLRRSAGNSKQEIKPETADTQETVPTTEEEKKPTEAKKSYREMIESNEYKDAHQRHIQKVVKDRMKAHLAEEQEILSLVARNYNLDPTAETFREDLKKALQSDDTVYRRYAEEHDVPIEEARKTVDLEARLAQIKQAETRAQQDLEAQKKAEETNRLYHDFMQKANQTKELYPDFNPEEALKDRTFMQMTAAFMGDTTKAYRALNHDAIVSRERELASRAAESRVAESVKANAKRPQEGGISSSAAAQPADIMSMSSEEFAQFVESKRHARRT